MKRLAFILAFVFMFSCTASADNVETWHDPSFRVNGQKKMFIIPAEISLTAGNSLAPERQQNMQIDDWIYDAVRAGLKRSGTTIIKPVEGLLDDMKFIYGNDNPSDEEFFAHAADMGYTAFIRTSIFQEFRTEHVPEEVRTYTEYRDVERYDGRGRLIEVIKVPEERTEVIPAHDVEYLYTLCQPEIYSVREYNGDYKAVVVNTIYREYQGGDVMGVVKNIVKASMRELFNQPDAKASKRKSRLITEMARPDSRR